MTKKKPQPKRRYVVSITEALHKRLSIYCTRHGMKKQDFASQAIANELKGKR